MARVCSMCGKGRMSGYKVSHSNKKANKVWDINLQKVKLEVDGAPVTEKVCTKCLKALKSTEI